jgi:hypothetical protein
MFISIGKETELWNWACDDVTKNTEREHPFFPMGTFAVHFWKNMTRWDTVFKPEVRHAWEVSHSFWNSRFGQFAKLQMW